MLEGYVFKDGKMLRRGYTTGSCAAAAAMAAAKMLLGGEKVETVKLTVPSGDTLELEILNPETGADFASCAVKKDAGDDPDVTDGILVCARAEKIPFGIKTDGGEGVGRVTKKGLDQPVGAAAINSVPRKMIERAVDEVCKRCGYGGGIRITISVPGGEELAKNTYNPRMGIEGGISIIGTTGIVEPMSTDAVIETTRAQMRILRAEGEKTLLLTVGNYAKSFIARELPFLSGKSATCGNYIGAALDSAVELGFSGALIVGHAGKTVKLGAGIMNTHSAQADGRIEVLVTCGLLAGTDVETLKKIVDCVTVDAAFSLLKDAGTLEKTSEILMERTYRALDARVKGAIEVGAVIFSDKFGIIGTTENADYLAKKITEEENG